MNTVIKSSPIWYYLDHSASSCSVPSTEYQLMGLYYIHDWCFQNFTQESSFEVQGFKRKKVKKTGKFQWKYHLIHSDTFIWLPSEYIQNLTANTYSLFQLNELEIKNMYF